MTEATVIIDALLANVRSVPSLSPEDRVCDSDPQID